MQSAEFPHPNEQTPDEIYQDLIGSNHNLDSIIGLTVGPIANSSMSACPFCFEARASPSTVQCRGSETHNYCVACLDVSVLRFCASWFAPHSATFAEAAPHFLFSVRFSSHGATCIAPLHAAHVCAGFVSQSHSATTFAPHPTTTTTPLQHRSSPCLKLPSLRRVERLLSVCP